MNAVPDHSGRRPLSYWQHAEAVSGQTVAEDAWLKSRCQADELEAQTRTIAAKLRAVGIPTERKMEGDLCIVGVFTGSWCKLTPWRHINFLPSVASSNRRQLIKRLSFYADSRPYLKYTIFTNGPRCGIDELRTRLKSLARSISRYAAEPQLKKWGITVELRACEITAERDSSGVLSYHPHANVIINCAKHIDYSAFLKWSHAHTPGKWEECKRLVDANEAVKYFLKPAEILDHNHRELRELFTATFGLRLVEPMAGFREFNLSLKESRVKLSKRKDHTETWRWCFVKIADVAPKSRPKDFAKTDHVMALMTPQPRFTPKFEPCLLVRNFSGSIDHVLRENRLADRFQSAKAAYDGALSGSPIPSTPSPQLSEPEFPWTGKFPSQNGTQQRAGPRIYHLETTTQ